MSNREKATYAFIDSQNLNLGVRSLRWELDFKKFRKLLADKYQVKEAYLFIGHVEGNESLYEYLEEAGYKVIFKPTLEYSKDDEQHTKGNVDAELVMHTMLQWDNFDQAIIVSGDGDFYCLVEELAKSDKLKKVIVPNFKYSSLLRKFADYIVPITLFKSKVILQRRRQQRETKTKTDEPKEAQRIAPQAPTTAPKTNNTNLKAQRRGKQVNDRKREPNRQIRKQAQTPTQTKTRKRGFTITQD